MLLPQEYLWNIHWCATKQHKCVKRSPVINNPKLAEDEGDSEWAMSLFTQKLFCFALEQNSDTVGGENQSSQPREGERKKWEPWEALIIVMDLNQLCESHFILYVYQIRNAFASHFAALVAAWKEN